MIQEKYVVVIHQQSDRDRIVKLAKFIGFTGLNQSGFGSQSHWVYVL